MRIDEDLNTAASRHDHKVAIPASRMFWFLFFLNEKNDLYKTLVQGDFYLSSLQVVGFQHLKVKWEEFPQCKAVIGGSQ